jgi:hypothetical protein
MANRDAVRVGNRYAQLSPRAADGSGGQLAAQDGVERAEAVALTRALG